MFCFVILDLVYLCCQFLWIVYFWFPFRCSQTFIGILMRTNCAPLLVNLYFTAMRRTLYHKVTKDKRITDANGFNLTFIYIDDDNDTNFANWLPLIYSTIWDKTKNRNSCICFIVHTFNSNWTSMVNSLPDSTIRRKIEEQTTI